MSYILDAPNQEVLALLEENSSFAKYSYKKGQILLWQGDRVEYVSVIRHGAVKIFSVSDEGRIYTYGILGKGGLVGAPELLTGEGARVMVEALGDTDTLKIPAEDFQQLLSSNSRLGYIVLKKLAKELIYISDKAKGLGFFNVRQRLKQILLYLSLEYGQKTEKGIKIKLDITHKDIAELIGANRTTITQFINELKRHGLLAKEGKHWVITNPDEISVHEDIEPPSTKKGY